MYLSARKYRRSPKKSKRNKNGNNMEQLRTCLPSRSRSYSRLESAKGVISGMDPIHLTKVLVAATESYRILEVQVLGQGILRSQVSSLRARYERYWEIKHLLHFNQQNRSWQRLQECTTIPAPASQSHCISTIKKEMFYGVTYFNAVHRLCLRDHTTPQQLRTMTSHWRRRDSCEWSPLKCLRPWKQHGSRSFTVKHWQRNQEGFSKGCTWNWCREFILGNWVTCLTCCRAISCRSQSFQGKHMGWVIPIVILPLSQVTPQTRTCWQVPSEEKPIKYANYGMTALPPSRYHTCIRLGFLPIVCQHGPRMTGPMNAPSRSVHRSP